MTNFPWRKRPIETPWLIGFESYSDDYKVAGEICGMTDGEVSYLTDLFVEEPYRGQGRGRKLVEQFLEAAKGTTVIVLTTGAEGFYRKFGFSERMAMVWRKR